MELQTMINKSAQLVAAINYYPYWQAKVNGIEVGVGKFKGTFINIPVGSEANRVTLEYLSPYNFFKCQSIVGKL
jgi:uncharacterized membrane protein YfhO